MAIKWTKQDVIKRFQEAMQPTQTPGRSAPDGQATLQKLLQLKAQPQKALPEGSPNVQNR
jgi:hypothetical protein